VERTPRFPLLQGFPTAHRSLPYILLAKFTFDFREIPVREENKVFSFPNNTGEENEERR
jgi:hypothetical protein